MVQNPRPSRPLKANELHRNAILEDIQKNAREVYSHVFNKIDYDVLETDILQKVLDHDFNPAFQIRGYVKLLCNTPHYQDEFQKLSPTLQTQVQTFIKDPKYKGDIDALGFKVLDHKVSKPGPIQSLVAKFPQHMHDLPLVYEDQQKQKVVEVHHKERFQNWGHNVSNTPVFTFVPTTVLGVQNVVLYAIQKNLRVRCAGYRHSWAPIFGEGGEVLISFVNLAQVTTVPDPVTIAGGKFTGQGGANLKSVELVSGAAPGKQLVKAGASVTSEDFRRWQLDNEWVLPVDTLLVEVTMGGIASGMCHGAGIKHNAIPDYVRSIEYVDCKGKLQVVDSSTPKLLSVAAGNFGLLGVITHVTFELDPMSYALMKPRKVDIGLAVPPMRKEDIPEALRDNGDQLDPHAGWYSAADSDAQFQKAVKDFEDCALNDHYCEWFWAPYQQKAWVQTWKTELGSEGDTAYPDPWLTFLEWIEGWIGGVLTSSPFFQAIPEYWQAQLLATSAMAALPPTLGESIESAIKNEEATIKTAMPNALHMRRGVQNMRCLNMEFQIPLPPDHKDPTKPDLSVARRAWWDVINLVYEEADKGLPFDNSPMKLLLEMRIMGKSDLVLAPYHGNTLGTCSIGVLSIPKYASNFGNQVQEMLGHQPKDEQWESFLQKVSDKWFAIGAPTAERSEALNIRPHLAKEWDGLVFRGMDAREYLKKVAYKDQIASFKSIAKEIGSKQGWTVEEMRKRFSNPLFDEMVFEK